MAKIEVINCQLKLLACMPNNGQVSMEMTKIVLSRSNINLVPESEEKNCHLKTKNV